MSKIPDYLSGLIEHKTIETLSLDQVLSSFRKERFLFDPSNRVHSAVDPRNEEPVVFNPGRTLRPHDYPVQNAIDDREKTACPICKGDTTGILDWAELKDGITFINKNLYPVLSLPEPDDGGDTSEFQGLHFVQWTSSQHDHDWYNMTVDDCAMVLSRLSVLEKVLLDFSLEIKHRRELSGSSTKESWHVSIIKNVGSTVGGSLEHGHQQIILGNVTPRRILADQEFEEKEGISFVQYLIMKSSTKLIIRDYGGAVLLVTQFMRRPYEMILLVKDQDKRHLFELDNRELHEVAQGWKDASRAIRGIMPRLQREVAFNVVTHNGHGSGLYFEFLPFTQEQGGLEQLGLSVCQATPEGAADQIRQKLV